MPRIPIEKFFMKTAFNVAEMSYAERKKVGCVVAKDGNIISFGYNGTAKGQDNRCEYEVIEEMEIHSFSIMLDGSVSQRGKGKTKLVTKDNVIHAEMNAIGKLAQSTISGKGAEMFLTLSPCKACAAGIIASGIKKVYYNEAYRDDGGVKVLLDAGVEVEQMAL